MTSEEYWREREAEALRQRITDEREYDKQLRLIYRNMYDACEKEIQAFYSRYAGREGITLADAKKRITKADIAAYERKAAKYVREKNFSAKANEEMRLYNATMRINRLEMLRANLGLELIAGHDEIDKLTADILKGRTMEEFERQAGILGKSVRNNAQKANAIVNASFHNATFSDRIWQYQDAMREDLGKLLQTGLIQGKNPRVLARDIKKKFDTSTYNAERLMRTELARVQTEAQRQSFVRNGFDMFTFHVNTGCCDICKALDGKHFEVIKLMPGLNAPPMHPNCRCSVSAYEDSAEYEAWLNYLAEGGTTEEWNKRLKINSPSSTKSFKRSLREISEGKAGLEKRRQNMLKRLPKSGDYHRFEKNTVTTRDLAYLSAATGVEFALFRSKNKDILIRGTSANCNVTGDLAVEIRERGYEWVAHSHTDGGKLRPSREDRQTLREIKQSTSRLIGVDGEEITFGQSEFDD